MSDAVRVVLFDGGNTYLKWAMVDEHARLINHGRCRWRALGEPADNAPDELPVAVDTANTSEPIDNAGGETALAQTLQRVLPWPQLETCQLAVLGSVADCDRNRVLRQMLSEAGIHCRMVAVEATWSSLNIAYEDPQALGVDRWLAMLGAQHLCDGAFVVADCGTALTLDAVNKEGQHLGGLIAPGFELMQQCLLTRTARIRDASEPLPDSMFGASTADAVNAGCSYPAGVMLDRFVDETARLCAASSMAKPRVFVTGGGSERLLHGATSDAQWVADLVLLGLLRWSEEASL